ncbi:MAG: hypothetical protein NTW62_03620 [Candidatus Nomurabacteria bacterium]|nr:hypothetical protein [Candidatus Nomurabacteria bacterium]
MKFLRPKKDEKTKHFFMQDIVRRTIDNHPILKENLPVIEIHFDRAKELFLEHRRAIFGILTLVVSLSILSAFSMGHASVTNFYPTSCLGGWEHPENAQGEPDLPSGSSPESFSVSNSARLDKSSGSIFCGGFKGEVLDNTQPTNFHLSFSWSVDDGSVNHNEVKPFENVSNTDQQNTNPVDNTNSNSTDTNNSTATDVNNNSNLDLIEVPSNSDTQNNSADNSVNIPSSDPAPAPVESAPAPEPAPSQNDNPVSAFLYNLFSTPAFAEDFSNSSSTPELISEPVVTDTSTDSNASTSSENKNTGDELLNQELNSDKNLSDAFAEVEYTLDGTDWKTLGTISRSQWQNASFNIPLDAWANLDNLQVSIKTLPTYDTPAVIYLDAMKMSVEYQDIKEILNRPTVELKDSSNVISSPQQDFNSSENVNFTINTPNLDINDIKDLVNNGTAEIVDDKAGVLTDTPVIDNTTSNNTINSIKDIVKPTADSLNKALPDDLNSAQVIVLPDIPKTTTDTKIITEEKPVSLLDFFETKKALADAPDITAKVLDLNGDDTDISARVVPVTINGINKQQVQIIKGREFKPGKYTLKVSVNTPQAIIVSQQDFTWGVLSINTNKSIFEVGDDAYLQMGVLNDGGHTICDADLNLSITSPSGIVNNFSTSDDSIIREKQCGPDNVISVPDYYAHFNIPSEIGTYTMRLTANTINGTKNISDTFNVVHNSNFVVERVGPSRIYPYDTPYPMNIKITAKNNWQGIVSEYVPESFDISQDTNGVQYISVNIVEDPSDPTIQVKKISWNVSLVANQETDLGYIFNAPPVSPEFYILGKIQLNNNGNLSFEEARNWQIASDAACNATVTGTWGGTDTATFTSCTGAASTGTGTGARPGSADTLTINSGVVVTLATTASLTSLTLATSTVANGLVINDGNTLTVSGALTFNTSVTNSSVTLGSSTGAGNLTVGSISMAAPTTAVASIEKINCSASGTGTLTVSGTGTIAITGSSTASNTGSASIDMTAGACNVITGTGTNTLTAGTTGATPNAFIRMGTGTITFNSSLTFAGATASKDALITANGTTISLNNASLPAVGTSGSYTITGNTNLISAGTSSVAYATAVSTWGTLTVNSGTLTLSAAAETFTGAVNIAGGTLSLGNTFTASSTTSVTGTISNLNSATVKTFTGLVTVNSGGSINLTTATVPVVVIGAGVTTSSGASTVNFGTGATTFSNASPTFTGPVAVTIGAVTLASGQTLTNNMSATLTLASLTFGSAPASAITATLSTGSTTTVTGAITYAVGASAQSESILLNGTANLNAGSISMPAMTAAGSALITCVSSCSGTLTTTGAVTVTGNSTAAQTGVSTIAMSTGNMSIGGLLTIAGGTVTAATVSQSTGNMTLSAGITFSGTAANTRLTTTGANTISFAGNWTNTSAPTLTINSGTTLKTTGTATLCVTNGMTWPGKLWVSAGTTSLALAETITGTTQVTSTLNNTNGNTAKIFGGLITVNSGGTFDMTVVTAPSVEFRGGIQVDSGAVKFATTGTTTFTTANQSISGGGSIGISFGVATVNANILLTNSYTGGTVTFNSTLNLTAPTSASDGLSLSTGTTTVVTTIITLGANAAAGAFTELVTLNGTAVFTAGTTTLSAPTSTTAGATEGIIAASGASGNVSLGATTLTCTGVGTQFCGIDLSLGTNALSVSTLSASGSNTDVAKVLMSSGTFTSSGLITITGASTLNPSAVLTTTTGNVNINAGLTFAGTVANTQWNTGAEIINFVGTMSGAGVININSGATFNTSGVASLSSPITLPNLNILSGTTTMGAILITVSGATNVTGAMVNASSALAKTFTGLVTVNNGGSINLTTATVPAVSFATGVTTVTGAGTVNFGTGATTFTASSSFNGPVGITIGATTINSGVVVTNNNTATVTMSSLTLASATSGTTGMSLTTGSTTTITGALTYTANAGVGLNEVITMNGTANLNAGSVVMPAGSNTGNSSVTCAAGSGTFTVTGALGVTAGTTAGASTLAMDTCTLAANGLVTITGGTVGVASISASTGTLDFNAGITFAVTLAQARITTSGAANIYITGTVGGVGILSGINSATTIYTQGVVNINAALTFPNMTVSTGTTTISQATTISNGLTVSSGAILQFTGVAFTSSSTTTVNGAINCTVAATCTGTKTFTGAVTVNNGGSFNLNTPAPSVFPTLVFGSDITVNTGGDLNTGIAGTTNTFTGNLTLSGGGTMTFNGTVANATTINSGVLVTNSNTNTVTFGVLTLASGSTGLSLSTGSTTTVSGLLSASANATATNTNIAMNGTANLNAGTFTITPPTSTGNVGVTCNASSGTFTVTGVTTISGNATSTGTANMLMDSCNFSAGGAVNMGGGANAVGGIDTLSFSTGTLTFLTGITFAGTSQARNKLTTTGAGIINLTGTMTGGGTISIDSTTTFNTTGTTGFSSPITLPNLNVLSGTTTMNGVTITVNGATNISGTLATGSITGTKTFTGLVDVNPSASFDFTAFATATSFGSGINMDGTTFNTGTGTTTFSASQSLSGSTAMIFGGAVTISSGFTLTNSNTSTVDFNSSITGGNGSSNFATDINSTTNFGGATMATGTLTPSTSVNTIAYDGGTQTIEAPITNPYYNLNITAAGVKSLAAITTVTNTINISAGTLDTTSASHYNINTGNMTIGGSGTLLGQAATITLTGNWSNAGVFTAGTSTVIMNGGTTASVTGTTTFNNLTITHTSAKEVDFDSTGITHVTGIFTVTGHSGNLITLRSDATPTKWQIHPTGTASADYVDVMDGGCQSGSTNISPTNFTNSGNNDGCWVPTFVSFTYSNSDSSIGFGTLSSLGVCYATNDTLGSATDVVAHSLNMVTNAVSGYTLTYFGNTLTSGLNTISPAININTGGTSGTSQFAISGTMTSSGTGAMVSGYNHVTPQWSFVDGATTTIASSSGPATSDTVDMHYEANISPITPAGNYSTNITYIVTGNF